MKVIITNIHNSVTTYPEVTDVDIHNGFYIVYLKDNVTMLFPICNILEITETE